MSRQFRLAGWLSLCVFLASTVQSAETVIASLEKQSTWTGEPVPLIITLYSPGPFSGTASFDFPELPQTVILSAGRPLVGSEPIDDETFFTQRHEFNLYTQRAGNIVIPSFKVRFEGKQTFTSEPEPIGGATQTLEFQSNRPPGTQSVGVVIAATSMKASQTWLAEDRALIHAGDVIERTIERSATDTTAMMMPPSNSKAPDGVRVYQTNPTVEDRSGRGETTAVRIETFKYQFEKTGTFELPSLKYVWWDSGADELKTETVTGASINVAAQASEATATSPAPSAWWWQPLMFALPVIGIIAALLRKPAAAAIARWQTIRNRPENVAARRLRAACKQENPTEAYRAALQFQRTLVGTQEPNSEANLAFQAEVDNLSRSLFSTVPNTAQWSGERLLRAFHELNRSLRVSARQQNASHGLPLLNPNRS